MSEGNGVMKRVDTRFRRLEGHEVIIGWDMLFDAIAKSELYTDATIANMLMDCVGQRSQCWIFKESDGLKCVVITKLFSVAGGRKLLIDHTNSFEGGVDESGWSLIYGRLLQYGQGCQCNEIEAFTDNAKIKQLLRERGFSESSVFRKEITSCPQEAEPAAK